MGTRGKVRIKRGDTLFRHSLHFFRSPYYVDLLKKVNGFGSNLIIANSLLTIPSAREAMAFAAREYNRRIKAGSLPYRYMHIQISRNFNLKMKERQKIRIFRGDTLFFYAMNFFYSPSYVSLLKEVNKLSSSLIIAGSSLMIPSANEAMAYALRIYRSRLKGVKAVTKKKKDPFSLPLPDRKYFSSAYAKKFSYPISQVVPVYFGNKKEFPLSFAYLARYFKKYMAAEILFPMGNALP
ncbi:LysM peptidoglycan-binding domain-containing protein [Candidatus Riflebacteria bacterium]